MVPRVAGTLGVPLNFPHSSRENLKIQIIVVEMELNTCKLLENGMLSMLGFLGSLLLCFKMSTNGHPHFPIYRNRTRILIAPPMGMTWVRYLGQPILQQVDIHYLRHLMLGIVENLRYSLMGIYRGGSSISIVHSNNSLVESRSMLTR